MAEFPDHFSSTASGYANFRPVYPPALFAWLASVVQDHRLVWDCATGTGQAALPLAEHFARVVATDASAAQLGQAPRHRAVHYVATSAERSALAHRSAGLVTVAQALHWFDRPRFYAEVQRVLVPRGVVAVWSYGLLTLHEPALDDVLRRFHGETVGAYWPPERRLVDEGYRGLVLPFERLDAPAFSMQADWTLEHLGGYLATWSAVQRARAATGGDPIPAVIDALREAWGSGEARRVEWPMTVHAGRV